MENLLIATTNQNSQQKMRECLASNYTLSIVSDLKNFWTLLKNKRYDCLFIDYEFLTNTLIKEQDSNLLLKPILEIHPKLPIIILAKQDHMQETVNTINLGAHGYLNYPLETSEILFTLESLQETLIQKSELLFLRDQFWKKEAREVIATEASLMKAVYDKLKSAAPTKANILLIGETGTGKGVLARLIHQHSTRFENQFIAVHCGAVPDNLIESELFGHEKGAFTGALHRKLGKFEVAHGGTLFLDEIGTMPMTAQIKLLNILQDKTLQRVGGNETISTDVRIIAATNANLKEMVKAGNFREDLYFRLNVFPIEIPPLRERIEDITLLLNLFIKRLNLEYSKSIKGALPKVIDALQSYSWPGNIRELENLIERAYILETSDFLSAESFPSDFFTFQTAGNPNDIDLNITLAEARRIGIENIEKRYLRELLSAHQGKISESAQAAGISSRQLHKLMTKHAIKKEDFKHLPALVTNQQELL